MPAPSETIALSAVRLGGGLDHHLASDREADAADPLGVDVGTAPEELHGGVEVALALPSPGVRVAVALAFAAPVEEEDAVAMAREQPALASAGPFVRERR